jgi:hypothetical protein
VLFCTVDIRFRTINTRRTIGISIHVCIYTYISFALTVRKSLIYSAKVEDNILKGIMSLWIPGWCMTNCTYT